MIISVASICQINLVRRNGCLCYCDANLLTLVLVSGHSAERVLKERHFEIEDDVASHEAETAPWVGRTRTNTGQKRISIFGSARNSRSPAQVCPARGGIWNYSFAAQLTSGWPTAVTNMADVRTSRRDEKHGSWLTVRAVAKEKPEMSDLNMSAPLF